MICRSCLQFLDPAHFTKGKPVRQSGCSSGSRLTHCCPSASHVART